MTATGFSIYAQIISASSGSKPGAKAEDGGADEIAACSSRARVSVWAA